MNRTTIAFLCLSLSIVLTAPTRARAETFNAKPGAWEMTSVTTRTGGAPLPQAQLTPEQLAKLPPAARAQLEQSMKMLSGEPVVTKTCVTQQDLDQDRMVKRGSEHGDCKRNVVTKTATQLVMETNCAKGMDSKIDLQAKTPETIEATMDMTRADRPEKMHIVMKGRWLGASCEGIKKDEE